MKTKTDLYLPTPVISACALDHHGKSSFLFTAPKPLAVFHIDPNTEELYEKLAANGTIDRTDVRMHPIPFPASCFGDKDELQDLSAHAWEDDFIDPLKDALEDDEIQAIGLDTATELFELKLMADHGKTVQIMPEMRTKTNYKFKGLLNALKRSKKTIVLLHRLRESYESKEITTNQGIVESREKVQGLYEREGFNKTGFHVNVEVMLWFDPTKETKHDANKYGVRFYSSTARPSLVSSMEFRNDEHMQYGREKQEDGTRIVRASVPWVLHQVYPDIPIEHWQ